MVLPLCLIRSSNGNNVTTEATELHWAVCSGNPEKVREALASPQIRATISTPDPHGWTPLHMASVLGNWEICELLLEVAGNASFLVPGYHN
jgi:ankyrin repeat protein